MIMFYLRPSHSSHTVPCILQLLLCVFSGLLDAWVRLVIVQQPSAFSVCGSCSSVPYLSQVQNRVRGRDYSQAKWECSVPVRFSLAINVPIRCHFMISVRRSHREMAGKRSEGYHQSQGRTDSSTREWRARCTNTMPQVRFLGRG